MNRKHMTVKESQIQYMVLQLNSLQGSYSIFVFQKVMYTATH